MQIDKLPIIEIADKVLLQFNDHEMTGLYFPFIKAGLPENEIQEGKHSLLISNTIDILTRLGYIEKTGTGQWYSLTDFGRQIKDAGGHLAYENKIANKAKIDKERQRLNDEKLRYDVKNAKRIFKTYWWTFTISIVGFLLALGKIIYDIVKAK